MAAAGRFLSFSDLFPVFALVSHQIALITGIFKHLQKACIANAGSARKLAEAPPMPATAAAASIAFFTFFARRDARYLLL